MNRQDEKSRLDSLMNPSSQRASDSTASSRSLNRRALLAASGAATLGALTTGVSRAQESTEPAVASRLTYTKPDTQLWQVGVKVLTGSSCKNLFATFPVPTPWPEQTVKVVNKDLSRYVSKWDTRDLLSGAKQVLVEMVNIPAGTPSNALFTFEVTTSRIVGPEKTDDLVIPKKLDRKERVFLGKSPYIDPRHGKIRKVSAELAAESTEATDWEKVERIYDWVRDTVEYREGKIKSATKALEDGFGDCEEMTSLFVAVCRASRIPARVVWVPGHCYPEFMLVDSDENPHWFPCQAAGTRQFGEMDSYKPILQKGDCFKVPEKKDVQRYVAEFCKVTGTRTKPGIEFVRKLSSDE